LHASKSLSFGEGFRERSVNYYYNNLIEINSIIHKILVNNWETPPEFSQSVIYYPPDKSEGYAQETLTEIHVLDQYLIYQVE
jgi:hypothetical protein